MRSRSELAVSRLTNEILVPGARALLQRQRGAVWITRRAVLDSTHSLRIMRITSTAASVVLLYCPQSSRQRDYHQIDKINGDMDNARFSSVGEMDTNLGAGEFEDEGSGCRRCSPALWMVPVRARGSSHHSPCGPPPEPPRQGLVVRCLAFIVVEACPSTEAPGPPHRRLYEVCRRERVKRDIEV
jgi:hypothetical protein